MASTGMAPLLVMGSSWLWCILSAPFLSCDTTGVCLLIWEPCQWVRDCQRLCKRLQSLV